MSILVTGAGGHLGRQAVAHVLERVPAGRVAVAVRAPEKVADLRARGVEVRQADYDKPETMAAAFAHVDTLLLISTNGPDDLRVVQHRAAVAAAQSAAVKHLIYTSATDADTSKLGVGRVHRETEQAIKASGLTYTFLRNAMYTDNWTAAAPQYASSGIVAANTGDGRIATATRSDLALAAAVVATTSGHENRTYELTGHELWSFADLAAEVARQTGRPVRYNAIGDDEQRAFFAGIGLPGFLIETLVDIQAGIARGELTTRTGDLARLIGRPAQTLADSVAEALLAAGQLAQA